MAVAALVLLKAFKQPWSSAESWGRMADFGLKLGVILAAIAATGYLAPRGDINTTVVPSVRLTKSAYAMPTKP